MDERTYKLFRYHREALDFFKSPKTALWATKLHMALRSRARDIRRTCQKSMPSKPSEIPI